MQRAPEGDRDSPPCSTDPISVQFKYFMIVTDTKAFRSHVQHCKLRLVVYFFQDYCDRSRVIDLIIMDRAKSINRDNGKRKKYSWQKETTRKKNSWLNGCAVYFDMIHLVCVNLQGDERREEKSLDFLCVLTSQIYTQIIWTSCKLCFIIIVSSLSEVVNIWRK